MFFVALRLDLIKHWNLETNSKYFEHTEKIPQKIQRINYFSLVCSNNHLNLFKQELLDYLSLNK